MKTILILATFGTFIFSVSSKAENFITHDSKGNVIATFESVDHPKLGKSWKDSNGLIWSQVIARKVANCYRDTSNENCLKSSLRYPFIKDNVILDSPATQICSGLGKNIHLPSVYEFEKLRKFFEISEIPTIMTDLGASEFRKYFEIDNADHRISEFWTSSISGIKLHYPYDELQKEALVITIMINGYLQYSDSFASSIAPRSDDLFAGVVCVDSDQ